MERIEYKSVFNSNSLTGPFDDDLTSVYVDESKIDSQGYLSKHGTINHNNTVEKMSRVKR
jgi:hypothetical protein